MKYYTYVFMKLHKYFQRQDFKHLIELGVLIILLLFFTLGLMHCSNSDTISCIEDRHLYGFLRGF